MNKKNNSIVNPKSFVHFKGNDDFIKEVLRIEERVQHSTWGYLTRFLTIHEQEIIHSLFQNNYKCSFMDERFERKRCFISENDVGYDFEVAYLEIAYNQKYDSIKHSDVLGSILALQIKRDRIGDILIGERIFVVVDVKMKDYLIDNLVQIGRAKVNVTQVDTLVFPENPMRQTKELIIKSMRIDLILSRHFNLSRTEVNSMIDRGYVQYNQQVIEDRSIVCQVGDVISSRRFGKFKVIDIKGSTKKGNIVIIIECY